LPADAGALGPLPRPSPAGSPQRSRDRLAARRDRSVDRRTGCTMSGCAAPPRTHEPHERKDEGKMARYSDEVPRQWLNAETLKRIAPRGLWLTVVDAHTMMIGRPPEQERKVVLSFREREEKLSLNRINGDRLAEDFGDEMDRWIECRVFVCTQAVQFGAKNTLGIRITRTQPANHVVPDDDGGDEPDDPYAEHLARDED